MLLTLDRAAPAGCLVAANTPGLPDVAAILASRLPTTRLTKIGSIAGGFAVYRLMQRVRKGRSYPQDHDTWQLFAFKGNIPVAFLVMQRLDAPATWQVLGSAVEPYYADGCILERLHNWLQSKAIALVPAEGATPSPTDLLQTAAFYEDQWEKGHPAAGPATRFRWRLISAYPISRLRDRTLEEWAEFMREEAQMWAEEGQPDRYADEIQNPTREPTVVVEVRGGAYVWDGNHRIGGSVLGGRCTVPAILGTPMVG